MSRTTLPLGQRVRRTTDGMFGVVDTGDDGRLIIRYHDRKDAYVTSRLQEWQAAEPEASNAALTREEIELVALAADRKLRALVLHQPDRWWEETGRERFDEGLCRVISQYLEDWRR